MDHGVGELYPLPVTIWLMSLTDVTMVQRGATYIMSIKEGIPRLLGGMRSLEMQSLADLFPTFKHFTGKVASQLTSLIV